MGVSLAVFMPRLGRICNRTAFLPLIPAPDPTTAGPRPDHKITSILSANSGPLNIISPLLAQEPRFPLMCLPRLISLSRKPK